MSKLLSSELARMFRSPVFWLLTVAMTVDQVYAVFTGERISENQEMYYLSMVPLSPIFFAAFISLFIGTEFSDKTIRNKVIVGCTRTQIYISYYLTCLIGVTIMNIVWILGGLAGIPVIGRWNIEPMLIMNYAAEIFLISLALTSVYTCISVTSANKTVSVAIQITVSFGLVVYSFWIHNKLLLDNVTEFTNKLYIMLMNMLPTGQGFLLIHTEALQKAPRSFLYQMICSVAIAVYFIVLGIDLFRKKDLK